MIVDSCRYFLHFYVNKLRQETVHTKTNKKCVISYLHVAYEILNYEIHNRISALVKAGY